MDDLCVYVIYIIYSVLAEMYLVITYNISVFSVTVSDGF